MLSVQEKLFEMSGSRAYPSSSTQSLVRVEEHNCTSSKGHQLCLDSSNEKNRPKMNANNPHFRGQ